MTPDTLKKNLSRFGHDLPTNIFRYTMLWLFLLFVWGWAIVCSEASEYLCVYAMGYGGYIPEKVRGITSVKALAEICFVLFLIKVFGHEILRLIGKRPDSNSYVFRLCPPIPKNEIFKTATYREEKIKLIAEVMVEDRQNGLTDLTAYTSYDLPYPEHFPLGHIKTGTVYVACEKPL